MIRHTLKEQILKLHYENKTYDEIREILHCAKSTICYYINPNQKNKKNIRQKRYRLTDPNYILKKKISTFISIKQNKYIIKTAKNKINRILPIKLYDFQRTSKTMNEITLDQILNKFGGSPKCYLTGRPIDLTKSKEYHFDHIIPSSKGGENTLDNLGLACKEANIAKNNLSVEQFIKLCKDVLENNGYTINKTES